MWFTLASDAKTIRLLESKERKSNSEPLQLRRQNHQHSVRLSSFCGFQKLVWPNGVINHFYGIIPLKEILGSPGIPAILTLTKAHAGGEDPLEPGFSAQDRL